jgi:hypothetical protein
MARESCDGGEEHSCFENNFNELDLILLLLLL